MIWWDTGSGSVFRPRGPQHLIVLFPMAVAMLPILLRTGSQRTLASPMDKEYPKPTRRIPLPCSPTEVNPDLFFCGLLGLDLGRLGLRLGFLVLAGHFELLASGKKFTLNVEKNPASGLATSLQTHPNDNAVVCQGSQDPTATRTCMTKKSFNLRP